MKKIRLNTDFVLEWRSILINGAPANFNELSPLLFLVVDPLGQAHAYTPTIIDDGHSLSVRIKASELTVQGIYSLTVYVHHGADGQTAIDRCGAFALAPSLCCPPSTPTFVEHVIITGGDVAVGVKGLSAYELAVKNGFEGSEQEWLQSLRQPATDAADNANQIMAEFQRKETAIIEAEQARVKAEQQRNTAEAQRIEDEASRTEAEQARTTAEQQRNTAEAQRIGAEISRTEAEVQRATAEQQRSEADHARAEAEQQRTEAEQQRNTAEAQRIEDEVSRTEAEVQRATAEQQRAEAEKARVTAEANRQQQTTAAIEAAKTATASATSATAEAAKAVTAATNATAEAKEAAKLATDAAGKTSTVDYAVCTTAATTATKEINIAGFALGTHCRFLVKMSHIAETEDVKLSVRSGDTLTEAKPLTFNGAPASVNNTWRAGDILDIYYDGLSFHATHYMGGYGITEINVSEMCPKGGHNGTNKFTLAEAIKKIPEVHQRVGFKCSFINDNNKLQTFVYQGGTWGNVASWVEGGGGSLRSLFIAAGNGKVKYNAQTGFYELHGLTDITEEEMTSIYTHRMIANNAELSGESTFYNYWWGCRDRVPLISSPNRSDGGWNNMMRACGGASFVKFPYICTAGDLSFTFYSCVKLREITELYVHQITDPNKMYAAFKNCKSLQHIKIKRLFVNVSFADSPLLTFDSLTCLVNYAENNKPISVKVHPTTYDYLTGVTQPTEQVGGTSEEWQALITTAAAKQITFTK